MSIAEKQKNLRKNILNENFGELVKRKFSFVLFEKKGENSK